MEDDKKIETPDAEHHHATGSMPASAGEPAQADPNPMPAEEHHDRVTGEDTEEPAGEQAGDTPEGGESEGEPAKDEAAGEGEPVNEPVEE